MNTPRTPAAIDTDMKKKIIGTYQHALTRASEVTKIMPQGWALTAQAPGSYPDVATLRVTRAGEMIAEFSYAKNDSFESSVVNLTRFPEAADMSHLKKLVNTLDNCVRTDKQNIAEAEAEERAKVDLFFGELDPGM